jgi:subtilisin family serine protease
LKAFRGLAVLTARMSIAMSALVFGISAQAADKIHLVRAADLPRFSYPVTGSVETLVEDKAAYEAFATQRRADLQSIFDKYQIDDNATLRGLVGEAALIDFMSGRYDDAYKESLQVRELQDKPSAKLLSGSELRAVIDAARTVGNTNSPEFQNAVTTRVSADLNKMPFKVVQDSVKEIEAGKSLAGEGRVIGRLRDVLQPIIDKNHALSSDLAPQVTGARYTLTVGLPLAKPLAKTYQEYLSANIVVKPDIWEARNVALPADAGYSPVTIGIWDSGVDVSLFPGRLDLSNGAPAVIAFDLDSRQTTGNLFPLTPDVVANLPREKGYLQGFSDLTSNIQSPQADQVKDLLSNLKPDAYRSTMESISMVDDWAHGTHVTGIATAGNPYARVAVARISFDYKLTPDPCPSRALTERTVQADFEYVKFFKAQHVRVVNMSWGGDVKGYESGLEQCGIGKTADDRKAIARELFDRERDGLKEAMASAPEILFVAAAGNSDNNAAFIENIPAGIQLPNLLAVGAVDQAGDEASFTSYGPTVVVDANGYQVKSVIPGGETVALSGTSMAAPQVTNLAGKLFAIDPRLTPERVVTLIKETSTKSDDQRRNLMNPAEAVKRLKGELGK